MEVSAGERKYGDADTIPRTAAAALSGGDAVALNGDGELIAHDSDANAGAGTVFFGIVADDAAVGDRVGVQVQGVVRANVGASTAAGDTLGATTTAGELGPTGDDGIIALEAAADGLALVLLSR